MREASQKHYMLYDCIYVKKPQYTNLIETRTRQLLARIWNEDRDGEQLRIGMFSSCVKRNVLILGYGDNQTTFLMC